MQDLILLGVSGNSREIIDIVEAINEAAPVPLYKCAGFLDDNESLHGTTIRALPVLGPIESALEFQDACFINGIGSVASYLYREAITQKSGICSERFPILVHPSVSFSGDALLSLGTVVFPNTFIGAGVTIGRHVVILSNTAVNHDVMIGAYTCVTSGVGISGKVRVGKYCYLGTNCSLIGGVSIGDRSLIGMGSVVLKDVQEGSVMVGNPARFLRRVDDVTCGQ